MTLPESNPGDHKAAKPVQDRLAYRLGDLLVRAGMKLKQQTRIGHTLASPMMAGR